MAWGFLGYLALQQGAWQEASEAFAQLVSRWKQPVMAFVFRTLPDPDEAEDLAQGVFVQLWRTAGRYQPTAKFSTFLFTIARNLRIDGLRRDQRAQRLESELMEAPPADEVLPDAALSSLESEARVRQALGSLSPEQLEIVKLSFFEDRPHGEISERLGIPLGTVKSRLRLAMKHLRKLLEEPL